MSSAQELADQIRNGNLSAVAAEVACDGPTALAVAALLDAHELDLLRRVLDDHLDGLTRPVQPMRVGGEARGGPVIPRYSPGQLHGMSGAV
jgi:hypothetical protein